VEKRDAKGKKKLSKRRSRVGEANDHVGKGGRKRRKNPEGKVSATFQRNEAGVFTGE